MISFRERYVSFETGVSAKEFLQKVQNTECVEKWLWIVHDKNCTDEHFHIYVEIKNNLKITEVAGLFGIDKVCVNKVRENVSIAEIVGYMTAKYSVEDLHSNFYGV